MNIYPLKFYQKKRFKKLNLPIRRILLIFVKIL